MVGIEIFKNLNGESFTVGEFINILYSVLDKSVVDLNTFNSIIQDNQRVVQSLNDERSK